MNFKNMKIEINEDQPLDEIVTVLERLGAKRVGNIMEIGFIISDGKLYTHCSRKNVDILYYDYILTTTAELKEIVK